MAEKGKVAKPKDIVSQDRNWVHRINSELESQKNWDGQWGYLSKGFSPQKTAQKESIEDKIHQLEQEVAEIDGNIYGKTSDAYGKGDNIEIYKQGKYNICVNKDLRALERRLPKGWKKTKWTPPVDPYDPLANAGKKK